MTKQNGVDVWPNAAIWMRDELRSKVRHHRVKHRCSKLLHNAVGLIISIRLLTFASSIRQKAPYDLIILWFKCYTTVFYTESVQQLINFRLHFRQNGFFFKKEYKILIKNLRQLKGYTTRFLREFRTKKLYKCTNSDNSETNCYTNL